MPTLTALNVYQLARGAGFGGGASTQAVAITFAESGWDTEIVNVNTDGSRDRGLWQINSRWHPNIGDTCCFDPVCATKEAARISNFGRDWSQWTSWDDGSAQAAAPRIARELLAAGLTFTDLTGGPFAGSGGGVGNVVDAVGDAAGALPIVGDALDAVDTVADAAIAAGRLAAKLLEWDTWRRVLLVLGGTLLLGLGAVLINRDVVANVAATAITKNPQAGQAAGQAAKSPRRKPPAQAAEPAALERKRSPSSSSSSSSPRSTSSKRSSASSSSPSSST